MASLLAIQTTPISNPKPHQNLISLIPNCTSLTQLHQIHAFVIKTHLQNDILLFNSLARGYSRSTTPFRAISLFSNFLSSSSLFLPDNYTFPPLLKASAASKAFQEGQQLHCHVIKSGMHLNPFVSPALIKMYAECADVDAARRVFDAVIHPCVVVYNAMITAYARRSNPNAALSLFREMQRRGVRPSDVTMLSVLSSCAMLGALDLGKWVDEYAKKNGFDGYVKVNTALVDMYAKCGSLEDAVRVFEDMSVRKDTQAWSTMIVAFASYGDVVKAMLMFEEMKKARIRPDEITFLGLLSACSHAGLVEEGFNYFYCMSERYGIVPNFKHYGCMVDLLGRSGRLREAYKFIDEMPIRPTPVMWRTLLSACGNHGDVEIGMQVLDRIFELDDSHGGDYVIMSNLCARAGRWEEVDRLRKIMKDRGVVKIPGCSSIEMNNVVHEFFSGDGERAVSKVLYQAVDELIENLKLVGYVPDTSLVFHSEMDDRDKELSLRYHSEKLAITYGILNTAPGTIIRVVKNLRICGDCHSAAKCISSMFNRKIVLRDVQRFHHFKDGKCSCGDYW